MSSNLTSDKHFFLLLESDAINAGLQDVQYGNEKALSDELQLIALQHKYFMCQMHANYLSIPIHSNARKHYEIKKGALKYKIDALERLNFRNINNASLNSQFIREEAEILYIKSLREKVFINKKLIAIPRMSKKH